MPLFRPILFFSRSVFGIHFRARTFVFVVFLWSGVFDSVLPVFLHTLVAILSRTCFIKSIFMSGLPFWGVRSLSWGSRRRRLCFLVLSKTKIRANRTPHTPVRFWLVPFFSRRGCGITRFGRASLLFAFFVGVPFWALRVFGILSEVHGA